MAIPAQSLRLVAAGVLPSGETFNTGLWAITDVPVTSYDSLVLTMAVPQSAFNAFFNSIKALYTAAQHPVELRGYYYSGGEFGSTAEFSAVLPLDQTAGTGTAKLPDQCTMVASLRSGRAGRSYRGRMYLPVTSINLNPDNQVPVATCDALALATKTLIDALNAAALTVSVVSAVQTTAVPVTLVQVDSIVDTQRRRRNKIKPVATSQLAIA